jgi:hypothetical protein
MASLIHRIDVGSVTESFRGDGILGVYPLTGDRWAVAWLPHWGRYLCDHNGYLLGQQDGPRTASGYKVFGSRPAALEFYREWLASWEARGPRSLTRPWDSKRTKTNARL